MVGFVSWTSCFQLDTLNVHDGIFISNINSGMYIFLSAETKDSNSHIFRPKECCSEVNFI